MPILTSQKNRIVNSPTMQIDKNVITYGNSFICTDNISLITISPIPSDNSWIKAIILGLISIPIISIHFIGVFILIAAIIWFFTVINNNNNRGENLAISLNAGNTLYFNCRDKIFLAKVVNTILDCIKNKNQSTYTINFDKCTINDGVLNNTILGNNNTAMQGNKVEGNATNISK